MDEGRTCLGCGGPVARPAGGNAPALCPACLETRPAVADGTGLTIVVGEAGRPRVESARPSVEALEDGDSPDTRFAPDTHLGKFRILSRLGEGAMGLVLKAMQEDLGRTVALKVIRTHDLALQTTERFLREARAAARLHHPHIVAVYEAGEVEGLHYIAMEYMDGSPLDEWLRASGRPMSRATPAAAGTDPLPRLSGSLDDPRTRTFLEMIAGIAEALQHAHDHGIVHRDVKPQNILIDRDGAAKLADFGLAKEVDAPTRLTLSCAIMGTPAYMSPEQARGVQSEIDGRTDLYAVGAVLYEALTGAPPHVAEGLVDLLQRISRNDAVAPRRLNRSVEPDLDTVVLRALEHDQERRYPTAGALAQELRRVLAGEPIQARPIGTWGRLRRRARRNPAAAILLLLLLGLLAAAGTGWGARSWLRRRDLRQAREEARASLAAGRLEEALQAAIKAQSMEPDDNAARDLVDRVRAEQLAVQGSAALAAFRSADEGARTARTKLDTTRRAAGSTPSKEATKEIWKLSEAVRQAGIGRAQRSGEAVALLTAALGYCRDHPSARRDLAEAYWLEFLDAERTADGVRQEWCRRLIGALGDPSQVARLDGRRPVRVRFVLPAAWQPGATEDPGAYLFRYEIHSTPPVIAPVPVRPDGGTTTAEATLGPTDPLPLNRLGGPAATAIRIATAFPLHADEHLRVHLAPTNGTLEFSATLPKGSYLLWMPGGDDLEECRYPFVVDREADWDETCELVAKADVPSLPPGTDPDCGSAADYWRYVPAGPFRAAGDERAVMDPGRDAARPRLPDATNAGKAAFLARFEVTSGIYARFLERSRWAPGERLARVPRRDMLAKEGGPYWAVDERGGVHLPDGWREDWPVFGISWYDANDCCQWLTEEIGGEEWEIMLPTEDEWEKGARGVDGRAFPWGEEFDRSFCRMQESRQGEAPSLAPEPFGFFPLDESPYGVRDMAGGVAEWTMTPGGPEGKWVIRKGTSWGRSAGEARAASRRAVYPMEVTGDPGFRLIAHRRVR